MAITINGSGTITGLSVGGLPDGIVDTDTIASSVSLGGLAVADQWCLTSTTTGDVNPITGWTRPTSTGRGNLGTGMTESSGIFTFPSTGYWLVSIHANITHTSDQRYHQVNIFHSTDSGSNYTHIADGNSSAGERATGEANALDSCEARVLFDITNISTSRIKFESNQNSGSEIWNSTTVNSTTAYFLKLGDT